MATMTTLTKITKREARARWNEGKLISVCQTRYLNDHHGQAITRDDMEGITFEELVEISIDTRRRYAPLQWGRPVD